MIPILACCCNFLKIELFFRNAGRFIFGSPSYHSIKSELIESKMFPYHVGFYICLSISADYSLFSDKNLSRFVDEMFLHRITFFHPPEFIFPPYEFPSDYLEIPSKRVGYTFFPKLISDVNAMSYYDSEAMRFKLPFCIIVPPSIFDSFFMSYSSSNPRIIHFNSDKYSEELSKISSLLSECLSFHNSVLEKCYKEIDSINSHCNDFRKKVNSSIAGTSITWKKDSEIEVFNKIVSILNTYKDYKFRYKCDYPVVSSIDIQFFPM